MTTNTQETLEELRAIREELLEQSKYADFKTFGYATDSNDEKETLLEILQKASAIRDELIEDTNMFPSGLTKISHELDWSSTQEQIVTEMDSLILDVHQSFAASIATGNEKEEIYINSKESFIEEIQKDSDFGEDMIEIPFGSNRSAFIWDDKTVTFNTFNEEQMKFKNIEDFASWHYDDDDSIVFGYQIALGSIEGDEEVFYREELAHYKQDIDEDGSLLWSEFIQVTNSQRVDAKFPKVDGIGTVICEGCSQEVSEDDLSDVMEMNICNKCENDEHVELENSYPITFEKLKAHLMAMGSKFDNEEASDVMLTEYVSILTDLPPLKEFVDYIAISTEYEFCDSCGMVVLNDNIHWEQEDWIVDRNYVSLCDSCNKEAKSEYKVSVAKKYEENTNNHYCEMCCFDTEHDNENECLTCGSGVSDTVLENEMMSKALEALGFTQENISVIKSGEFIPQIVSDDKFKAYAVGLFTSDGENGAKDYDDLMEGKSELSVWQPFECWLMEDVASEVESTYDSLRQWFAPELIRSEKSEAEDDEYRNTLTCNSCASDIDLCECEKEDADECESCKTVLLENDPAFKNDNDKLLCGECAFLCETCNTCHTKDNVVTSETGFNCKSCNDGAGESETDEYADGTKTTNWIEDEKCDAEVLEIRFLRQGFIKAQKPDGFDAMSNEQKEEWANGALESKSDFELVQGMADFSDADVHGDFFDETPRVAAIETRYGEDRVFETAEWNAFAYPAMVKHFKLTDGERNMLADLLAENDIKDIHEMLNGKDRSFLFSVLTGDGFIQYENMTDKQLFDEFIECSSAIALLDEMNEEKVQTIIDGIQEVSKKKGFYIDTANNQVKFIEVHKSEDTGDCAEEMLSENSAEAYCSFEDKELPAEYLEALEKLGVSVYIGIMARIHDESALKEFDVGDLEMKLFQKLRNYHLKFDWQAAVKKALANQIEIDTELITEDNIHLYYEFMSDDDLERYRDAINSTLIKRKKNIYYSLFDFGNIDNIQRSDILEYSRCGYNTNFRTDDASYITHSFLFGEKDTLKPIDGYIEEIKQSEAYKAFIVKTFLLGLTWGSDSSSVHTSEELKDYDFFTLFDMALNDVYSIDLKNDSVDFAKTKKLLLELMPYYGFDSFLNEYKEYILKDKKVMTTVACGFYYYCDKNYYTLDSDSKWMQIMDIEKLEKLENVTQWQALENGNVESLKKFISTK